ncbi:MAG TPA: ATPase domain-containing protein [Pyrinomonadaceae bacterium]
MSTTLSNTPEYLVEVCGSYGAAVASVMALGRALWSFVFDESSGDAEVVKDSPFRVFDEERVLGELSAPGREPRNPECAAAVIEQFKNKFCKLRGPDGRYYFELTALERFDIVWTLLSGLQPDREMRYYVMKDIRRQYDCGLSHRTAHDFYLLAGAVNKLLAAKEEDRKREAREGERKNAPKTAQRRYLALEYEGELIRTLRDTLLADRRDTTVSREPGGQPEELERRIGLFVECCRVAGGYLRAYRKRGYVTVLPNSFDAEYLLSNVFGMPTSIKGFDDLFGGGGVMLKEYPPHLHAPPLDKNVFPAPSLPGRTILIIGRFGTGKSLLSLQLAAEVARKGGLAWIMPLEQTAEECLYTLESMRVLPQDDSVVVATMRRVPAASTTKPAPAAEIAKASGAAEESPDHSALDEAAKEAEAEAADQATLDKVLDKAYGDKGAVIILTTIKDSYNDFLKTFEVDAQKMGKYPLRLMCVDPINSISRDKDSRLLRTQTMAALDKVKKAGINVILVAEEGSGAENELAFEQNIADTVINLSIRPRHDYSQRYIEITKSRLQRAQQGAHPFSIRPGEGFRIFPSSAAVSASIRARSIGPPETPIEFGLPSLDDLLGQDSLAEGDVIVFQGAGGSYKTPLGLLFLLGANRSVRAKQGKEVSPQTPLRPQSLLVTRDSEVAVEHLLSRRWVKNFTLAQRRAKKPVKWDSQEGREDIRVCSIRSPFAKPGYIIQKLEEELKAAYKRGCWIERIMIDNIAHWEMSSPFIRDDEVFGDVLIDFLRRRQLTSLLICGELPRDSKAALQRSIINNADCLMHFSQSEVMGINRVTIRVVKTRDMKHSRDLGQLTFDEEGIRVEVSPHLRMGPGGKIIPLKIRLFLHSTTKLQRAYNDKFLQTLKSSYSQDVRVERQDFYRINDPLNPSAPFQQPADELHLIQLDEFQVPALGRRGDPDESLAVFTMSPEEEREWRDYIPRLVEGVRSHTRYLAVPFYSNISLLAYHASILKEEDIASWESMAEANDRWERDPSPSQSLFFDFRRATGEDYNCLFFEMLLGKRPARDIPRHGQHCSLRDWLLGDDALETARTYWRLSRRAHMSGSRDADQRRRGQPAPAEPEPSAVVWRHWYGSLNQIMADMSPAERQDIRVSTLPGKVTVAGDWYLGIPRNSASPSVGVNIVKLLASKEAELERLQAGVGLPTRTTFYDSMLGEQAGTTSVLPYFTISVSDLKAAVTNPFRRSGFGCYSQLSPVISYHLQRILELPAGDEELLEKRIRGIFDSLKTQIDYASVCQDCQKCRLRRWPNT